MVIVGVLPSDTYRIKRLNDFKDRGFESTAHVSQLKIWRGSKDNKINDESESESVDSSEDERVENCDSVTQESVRSDNKIKINEKIDRSDLKRSRQAPARLKDFECS